MKSVAAGAVVASLCLIGAALVLVRMMEIRELVRHVGPIDFTTGTDVPGLLTGGGGGAALVFLMALVLAPLSVVLATGAGGSSTSRGFSLMACGFAVLAAGIFSFELRMADARRVLAETMGDANFEPIVTASLGENLSNILFGLAGAALPLGMGLALIVASRPKASVLTR